MADLIGNTPIIAGGTDTTNYQPMIDNVYKFTKLGVDAALANKQIDKTGQSAGYDFTVGPSSVTGGLISTLTSGGNNFAIFAIIAVVIYLATGK